MHLKRSTVAKIGLSAVGLGLLMITASYFLSASIAADEAVHSRKWSLGSHLNRNGAKLRSLVSRLKSKLKRPKPAPDAP